MQHRLFRQAADRSAAFSEIENRTAGGHCCCKIWEKTEEIWLGAAADFVEILNPPARILKVGSIIKN
jgi:hypothetical protein